MKILYGSNFIGQADSSGNANQKPVEAYEGFQPESMGLNLEERNSTATITLSPEQPQMTVGMWLRDDTEPGLGMVWRVKTVNEQYDRKTITASLEHISATLKDWILFGEHNWKIMAGSASATGCTPRQAVNYICNQTGGLWALAEIASEWDDPLNPVTFPYVFNGDNLFSALETVASALQDSYLEFGTDSIPFYIAIRKASSDVAAEMRMNRNIQSIRKTVDRSRMFTRFYPIGQKDLHYIGPNSEPYMSRNENVYGIISKVATDQTITTQAGLAAWATEQLQRHADPAVTVQISGVDLGRATGEPLDWVEINKRCRVPLPEFNTVITEKVTKISWPDKVKEKDRFTVTLANELQDVAKILNQQNKSAGKSGRSQAKKEKEDTEWFVDVELGHLLIKAEKSQDGTQLKLWELEDKDSATPTITFNKAASGDIDSIVGTWSGNHYSVLVSPQDVTGGDTYVYVTTPSWTNIEDGKKGTISFYYLNNGVQTEILPATFNMKLTGSWSGNTYTAGMYHGSTQIYTISTNTFVSTPVWGTGDDANKVSVSFYYFDSNQTAQEILPATIRVKNLTPENVKTGVEIGGVTGEYGGGAALEGSWDGARKFTVTSPGSTSVYTTIVGSVAQLNSSWADNVVTLNLRATIGASSSTVDVGSVSYSVANLSAGNVKNGVVIGGVTGNYMGASYNDGWDACVAAITGPWNSPTNPASLPENEIGRGERWRIGVTYKDHSGTDHVLAYVVKCPNFWLYEYTGAENGNLLPYGSKWKIAYSDSGSPIGGSAGVFRVGTPAAHDPKIPSTYISTTDGTPPSSPTGGRAALPRAFATRFMQAYNDYETFYFRVDCGDVTRYFYIEPRG